MTINEKIDENERKPLNDTQVVVSFTKPDSFLMLRKFRKKTTVVSPFEFNGDDYESNFVAPTSLMHRIKNFYSMIEPMSKFTVSNSINFNCLSAYPVVEFGGQTQGWIHYNHSLLYQKQKEKNIKVNQVETKMLIGKIPSEKRKCGEFEIQNNIKFTLKNDEKLKVFPIFFRNGFLIVTVDKNRASLYTTINDSSKLFCGILMNHSEIMKLVGNVLPLFPIFRIDVNERFSTLFLKNLKDGRLKTFVNSLPKKAFVSIEFCFDQPNYNIITHLGNVIEEE